MTEEIKKRMEQINHGEVIDGYKKMRMGILPSDWEVTQIIDIAKDGISNGIFNDPKKEGGMTKLVNVVNLYDEPYINVNKLGYLNVSKKELEQYKVEKYDLFFTRSSLKLEGIAHCNMLIDDIEDIVYDCHIMKIKPRMDIIDPFYLCNILKSNMCRQQFMLRAKTTTMTTIGQQDISNVILPVPPIEEQQRIVNILSKWDEAVVLQEKLIKKLELKKKALMQKLLKPQDYWKKVKIGDLTKEVSDRNKNNDCKNIKSVSNKYGFINQDEQFSKQVASQDTSNYKKVYKGNIAYNPSRINIGSIALYNEAETGIVSPMYVVFECKKIDPKLLLLLLNSDRTQYDITTYLSGSVRDSLNYSDLRKIEIYLPDEKNQMKINEIFNMFDSYYILQAQKYEKLKKQQKAVQQLLLTGIVRV